MWKVIYHNSLIMKKFVTLFAVAAMFVSIDAMANEPKNKEKKKEKAKTEKEACSTEEKKSCSTGEKKACCASKKSEAKS